MMSSLEEHFLWVLKGKKIFLHEMEFGLDDFAVYPLLL